PLFFPERGRSRRRDRGRAPPPPPPASGRARAGRFAAGGEPFGRGGCLVRTGLLLLVLLVLLAPAALPATEGPTPRNLLLNPEFGFHAFGNSRRGDPVSYR